MRDSESLDKGIVKLQLAKKYAGTEVSKCNIIFMYFLCKTRLDSVFVLIDCCSFIYRQDFVMPAKNCQMLTFIIMLITINSLLYKLNACPRKNVCLGRLKGKFGCGAVVENAVQVLQREC